MSKVKRQYQNGKYVGNSYSLNKEQEQIADAVDKKYKPTREAIDSTRNVGTVRGGINNEQKSRLRMQNQNALGKNTSRFANIFRSTFNNARGAYTSALGTAQAHWESQNKDRVGYNTYLDNPMLKARDANGNDWTHESRMAQFEGQMARGDALLAKSQEQLDDAKLGLGKVGQFGVDALQQGLLMGSDIALGAVTGGVGGIAAMGARAYGQGANEARQDGYDINQQAGYGLLSASVEMATEKLFQGVSLLGKAYGGGAISEDMVQEYATRWAKNMAKTKEGATIAQALAKAGMAGVGEGIEEVLSDFANPLIKKMVSMEADPLSAKDIGRDFLMGAVLGAVTGGGSAVLDNYQGKGITDEALAKAVEDGSKLDESSDARRAVENYKKDIEQGKQITDAQKKEVVSAVAQETNANYQDASDLQNDATLGRMIGIEFASDEDAELANAAITKELDTTRNRIRKMMDSFQGLSTEEEVEPNENATVENDEAMRLAATIRGLANGENVQLHVEQLLPGNEMARQIFQGMTGITLDDSVEGTRQQVLDYMRTARIDLADNIGARMDEEFAEMYDSDISATDTAQSYGTHGRQGYSFAVSNALNKVRDNTSMSTKAKRDAVWGTQRAYEAYYSAGVDSTKETRGEVLARLNDTFKDSPLAKSERMAAFMAGENDKAQLHEAIEKVSKKEKPGKGRERAKAKRGTVDVRTEDDAFTEEQIKTFETFAKALNVNIRLEDASDKAGVNGFYDNNGTIVVYKNVNGDFRQNPYVTTVAHEFTHHLQITAVKEYQAFKDYVTSQLNLKAPDGFEKEINKRIKSYKEVGQTLTREQAIDEILADSAERFLTDPEFARELANKNKSLAEKLVDFLTDFIAKVKALIQDGSKLTNYGEFYDTLEIFEQARDLYAQAIEASVDNEVLDKEDQRLILNGGEERMSIATWFKSLAKTTSTQKPTEKLVDKIASGKEVTRDTMLQNGFTEEDFAGVDKFMDAMSKVMGEAGVKYHFLGIDDINNAEVQVRRTKKGKVRSVIMSAMVKNGEYPVNFDFTTVCKKRQTFMKVLDELSKNGTTDTISLDADKLFMINQALKEEGIETACLGCFVEARRYNIKNYTDKVVNLWNGLVDEVRAEQGLEGEAEYFVFGTEGADVEGMDFDAVEKAWNEYSKDKNAPKGNPTARLKTILTKGGADFQKYLRPSDLITEEGVNGLKAMSHGKQNLFTQLKSAYGTAAPKEVNSFTPYNNEIALLPKTISKKATGKYLRGIGGVRMQSFSDFLVANTFDYMQMVADLAARKFPAHAYTKEIAFARIFGMTGIKINMSVMFDMDTRLGKGYGGLRFVTKEEYDLIKKDYPIKEDYTLDGVEGYLIYNVADQENADRVEKELYDKAIAEGKSVEEAHKYAMKNKPFAQSINWKEAKALQNEPGYSDNIGTIGVGFSARHIRMMMRDPNIRYIIPYHASGMPGVIKARTNLDIADDFTDYQNTRRLVVKSKGGQEVKMDLKKYLKDAKGDWVKAIDALTVDAEANGWSVDIKGSKALAGHGDFDLYSDLGTKTPEEKAQEYMGWCADNGYVPLFHEFATEDGYYKTLFDFNVKNAQGETCPQGVVTNKYPGIDVSKGETDTGRLSEIIDAEMNLQNNINQYIDTRVGNVVDDISQQWADMAGEEARRYSKTVDSDGNELSLGILDYFKDSKVRDENGNLLKMYHGSAEDFYTFEKDKIRPVDYDAPFNGFWFSDDENTSPAFRGAEYTKAVYLNITNPAPYEVWKQVNEDVLDDWSLREGTRSVNDEVRYRLQDMGYDGVQFNGPYTFTDENIREYNEKGDTTFEGVRGKYHLYYDEEYARLARAGSHNEIAPYMDAEDFKEQNENVYKNETVWVAFEPTQIKSVDNLNPTEDPDIRYSVTHAEDAEYMEAVKSGDMEKAQEMVDKVARGNRYTKSAYHGTNSSFTKFSKKKLNSNTGALTSNVGFFFTDSNELASRFAKYNPDVISRAFGIEAKAEDQKILSVYLKLDSPLEFVGDDESDAFDKFHRYLTDFVIEKDKEIMDKWGEPATPEKELLGHGNRGYVRGLISDYFVPLLKKQGHDGIIVHSTRMDAIEKDERNNMFIVFDPNQIKSADPVTYDDDGNVIPLSERFKPENNDIRYSMNYKFDREFDEWDKEKIGFSFILGETSDVLMSVGLPKTKVRWDASKIKTILKEHAEVDEGIIKQVPYILERPIIVMRSASRPENSIVILGQVKGKNGKPVMVSVVLVDRDGFALDDFKVSSAYPRSSNNNLQNLINRSKIYYVDPNKKRTDNWLKVNRLQLPLLSTQFGPIASIADDFDFSNKRFSVSDEAYVTESALKAEQAKNRRLEKRLDKDLAKERLKLKKDKAIAREKRKHREYKANQKEKKERREVLGKIKKRYENLYKTLSNPTDAKHLPDGFDKAVADFLAPFNFETDRSKPDSKSAQERAQRYFNVADLADKLEKAAEDNDSTLIIDPTQVAIAKRVNKVIQNKRLADLTLEELQDVYKLMRLIDTVVSKANKSFTDGVTASINGRAQQAIQETRERGKVYKKGKAGDMLNQYLTSNTKPRDFFRVLTKEGGALYEAYMGMRRAFNRHIDNMTDFRNAWDKAVNYKQVKEWRKQSTKFKLESGKEIRLTVPQVMALYELNKRDQARGHIYGVGIVATDEELSRQAKKEDKGSKKENREAFVNKRVMVTVKDVENICRSLTDEQRKVANNLQRIMSTMGSEWGNQASLKMYNYRKFTEKDYFPISVLNTWLDEKGGVSQAQRIRTLGMTKQVTPNANNPLVLDDIFSVTIDHMNKMSMYTMTPELTDFERIWNYKNKEEGVSLREEFEATYGKNASAYVRNLMDNVNGYFAKDENIAIFDKMLSMFKRAKVGASLRVLVQQPTAILRAGVYINPAYLTAGMSQPNFRKARDEMFKYSQIARWKSWGFYETDTAKSMESIIENKRELADLTMGAYGVADNMAWVAMWNAVKMEVAKKNPKLAKGSPEFFKAVAERFEEVVDHTQVVDSVFHRSQLMRSKNVLIKGATAFMSEPTTTVNMLQTELLLAHQEAQAGEKSAAAKRVSKVMATLIATGVATSIASAAVDAMRHSWTGGDDDDEDKSLIQSLLLSSNVEALIQLEGLLAKWKHHGKDEEMTYLDRWIEHTKKNVPGNINPLQMMPFIKDIFSIVDGYSVERADISLISNVWDSVDKFKRYLDGDSSYGLPYIINDAIGSVGELAGIPYKNFSKDVIGLLRTGAEVAGHGDYANYLYNSTMYSQKSWNVEREVNSWLIARRKGNYADADKIRKSMMDKSGMTEADFNKTVKKVATDGLKDAIVGGDLEKVNQTRTVLKTAGWSGDDIDKVIQDTYKRAFKEALESYDASSIRSLANRMKHDGFSDDDIKTMTKSKYASDYKDAYIKGDRATISMIEKAAKSVGLSNKEMGTITADVDKELWKLDLMDAAKSGNRAEYNRLMAQAGKYYKNASANEIYRYVFVQSNEEQLRKEYGR